MNHCRYKQIFWLCLLTLLVNARVYADVVKPALVEISVTTAGDVTVELRASIEALLTGINAKYKNTKDAPTAEQYDAFRKMLPQQLRPAFDQFSPQLLDNIRLLAILDDNSSQRLNLKITQVEIPQPGYTKVPRISVILLHGRMPANAVGLQWYYPYKFGDNAVRVKQIDKKSEKWHWSQWQWLKNDESSRVFSLKALYAKPSAAKVIGNYVVLGFEHIVPKGVDHILFILGIFLLSLKPRTLLMQVTMFTLAHTITLALSANGVISLPPSVVQPLIALSIAYVGLENLFVHELHRWRMALVFAFGLLHGMGFAGVLNDFGMPKGEFVTALISFNVGVELGQIAVLGMAYLAVGLWFGRSPYYHQRVVVPASLLIGATGLYWTLARVFEF